MLEYTPYTPVELSFIQNEIEQQRLENIHYDMLERYLQGNVNVNVPSIVRDEITQKEVITNLLRPVLDSYVNMLNIKSITSSDTEKQKALDDYLEAISFSSVCHEAFATAGLFGKCYLQLVYNSENNVIDIIVLDPRNVRMIYSSENANVRLYAVKNWLDIDDRAHPIERTEKYYPDRVESYYRSAGQVDFLLYENEENPAVRPNPAGFIPIFELKNRGGISEIEAGIGTQDAINDWMLMAHERALYNAGGQYYIIGNVTIDPNQVQIKQSTDKEPAIYGGLGRKPFDIWNLGPDVKTVGKLEGDNIQQFFDGVKIKQEQMAVITSTSLGFLENTSVQTGAGVIAIQRPQLDKVRSAQKSYTDQLKYILRKVLLLQGIDTKVDLEWEDPAQFANKADDLKEFQAGALSIHDYHARQGIPELKIQAIIDNIKKEQEEGLLKGNSTTNSDNTNNTNNDVKNYGNESLVPKVAEIPESNQNSDAGEA